jgi:type II secretory pathway component PulK
MVMSARPPATRRRGLALVLTLWLVVLLVAMVYALLWDVQVEIRLRRMASDDLKARWLANAGVAKAVADLANDMVIERSEGNTPLDALGDVWAFDNEDKTDIALEDTTGRGHRRRGREEEGVGTFTVKVEDAESRINLDNASPDLLASLLIVLGEKDPLAAQLRGQAIVDWRDENTAPLSALAEPGFQERQHYSETLLDEEGIQWSGTMHNERYITVQELLMVPGITREMFEGPGQDGDAPQRGDRGHRRRGEPTAGLRDCVTTLSSGVININTARREVLGAMALTVLGPDADWEEVADAIIEQRDGHRLDDVDDDLPFHSVDELGNVPLAGGILQHRSEFHLDVRSHFFTVSATGRSGAARHSVVCEVRRDWEVYVDAEGMEQRMPQMLGRLRGTQTPAFSPTEDQSSGRGRSQRADRGDRRESSRGENGMVEKPAVRVLSWVEN